MNDLESEISLLAVEELDSVAGGRIDTYTINGSTVWVTQVAIGGQNMIIYAMQGGGSGAFFK